MTLWIVMSWVHWLKKYMISGLKKVFIKKFSVIKTQNIWNKYPDLFISAATCDLLKEKENDENFFLYDPFRVNEKENGHKIQSYNTSTKNY